MPADAKASPSRLLEVRCKRRKLYSGALDGARHLAPRVRFCSDEISDGTTISVLDYSAFSFLLAVLRYSLKEKVDARFQLNDH